MLRCRLAADRAASLTPTALPATRYSGSEPKGLMRRRTSYLWLAGWLPYRRLARRRGERRWRFRCQVGCEFALCSAPPISSLRRLKSRESGCRFRCAIGLRIVVDPLDLSNTCLYPSREFRNRTGKTTAAEAISTDGGSRRYSSHRR